MAYWPQMPQKRLLALLAPTLVALTALPAAAQTQVPAKIPRPALQASSLKPLTVEGSRFKANERVSVLVVTGGKSESKVVVASDKGTFTARFSVSVGRCGRFAIRAFGARGSTARLVPVGDWPDCVPDHGPPPPDDLPTLKRPRNP